MSCRRRGVDPQSLLAPETDAPVADGGDTDPAAELLETEETGAV